MKKIKRKVFIFLCLCISAVVCLHGICACTPNSDNSGNTSVTSPSTENEYFLQKIDIIGDALIRVGATSELKATASARTGANKTVTSTDGFTFESSAPSIAAVDANGVVSGLKEGESVITVKHAEFKAENTFKINVLSTVALNFETGEGINTFGRARLVDGGLLFANALSGFEVCFDGTELKGTFNCVTDGAAAKSSLFVEADGVSKTVEIANNNENTQISLASGLAKGLHTLRVYKTTGAEHSEIKLISLSDGVSYVQPVKSQTKITFLGDGITSGSDLSVSGDATKTYAFLTARELNAEPDVLSSDDAAIGVGETKIKDIWNRYASNSEEIYGNASDADYVIINVGDNDVENINGSQGTLSDYVDGYKQTVAAISGQNANAKIICCYGMTANCSVLAQTVKRIVAELNAAGNKNVYALQLERCDGKAKDDVTGKPNQYGHQLNAKRLKEAIGMLGSGEEISSLQDRVAYDPAKQDISVILLGGQSNMEGNSWWKYLEGEDARYNDYKNGFDDIKMSFANHEDDAGKAPSFNAVKLGYGGARNPGNGGDGTTCFGPEIGMAKVLHDSGYGNKVVFIKFAIGATYFHSDPDGRNWQAKNGKLYKAFIKYAGACIDELSKTYNVSIDAMCWMQGESDTEQQSHVDAYEGNLNNFVAELRKHYSKYNPDFMFYDAYIKWPRDWQGDRPDQINDIKQRLADENLHYEALDIVSAGLNGYYEPVGSVDLAHFDAASEIKLGEMFAQAYIKDFPIVK